MSDTSSTTTTAAAILHQMALGNDPTTGLALSPDHLLQRPEVIRALMLATELLSGTGKSRTRPAQPLRAGVAWTAAEEQELKDMFEHGGSIGSIAHSLQRSKMSIEARLVRLGLLDKLQVILEDAKAAPKR